MNITIKQLRAWSESLVLKPAHCVSYLTTAIGMVQWGHGLTALPLYSTPLLASYSVTGIPVQDPVIYRQVSLFTSLRKKASMRCARPIRMVNLRPASHANKTGEPMAG